MTLEAAVTTIAELATEHVVRRTPLTEVNAYFIYPGEKIKRRVLPSWKIARKAYNDLGPAWTENCVWYATNAPLRMIH
jgi:hypothetical protein